MIIYIINLGKGFLWDFCSHVLNIVMENFWSLMIIFLIVIILLVIMKIKKVKLKNIFRIELPKMIEYKNIKLHINKQNRKLAYNIWVELSTRKIALEFDEENDSILLVYKSWYEAFGLIREYIKELGSNEIDNDLRRTSLAILNNTLRPHLTKYHLRFDNWFNKTSTLDQDCQIIQKQYSLYNELVEDIKRVNKECQNYLKVLEVIINSKFCE